MKIFIKDQEIIGTTSYNFSNIEQSLYELISQLVLVEGKEAVKIILQNLLSQVDTMKTYDEYHEEFLEQRKNSK